MDNKKLHFNNIESPKKGIEIPKEELQSVQDIFSFLEQISKEGYSDDSTYALARHNFTATEIEERKNEEFKKTLDSLSEDDADTLRRKIKRESQYEANQAEIDFINDQFGKLLQYIESKEIWKHKFSTNHAFTLSQYHDFNFKGDASESEDYDKVNSYAGQSRDSIYYVSNSGLSLRLKKDLLMTHGLKAVLQKPQELIVFFNQREKQRRDLDVRETFNDIEKANSIDFPAELFSFEPKLEFNVYEFSMFNFNKDIDTNYNSNIQIEKIGDRILVKDYDNEHMGHQINKIYF